LSSERDRSPSGRQRTIAPEPARYPQGSPAPHRSGADSPDGGDRVRAAAPANGVTL
jgi:hypothetical protein